VSLQPKQEILLRLEDYIDKAADDTPRFKTAQLIFLFYTRNLGTPNFLFHTRFRLSSVSAQDLLRLAHPKYHFRQAAPQHAELLQL